MRNHTKTIVWPRTYQNPNCTLCHNNDKDTWPHLLLTCESPYIKGLRIARHNKAVHLITQALQRQQKYRFFTLINPGNLNILGLSPQMHMYTNNMPMPSQIKTTHPMHNRSPEPNTNTNITLSSTYNLTDRIYIMSLTQNNTKYNLLINTIQNNGWRTNPLITITTSVRSVIYELSTTKLTSLNIPKSNLKTLMKNLHQNAIKYITYLVLNKRKLNNKQTPTSPPQ